jgi:hypothetical protein
MAALAFAVAGIGLGVGVMSFAAGRAWRRGRIVPAPGAQDLTTMFMLLGLMNIGLGMEPALQRSPGGWTWLALLSSVAGGTLMGFVLHLRGRAPARKLLVDRPGQHPPSYL